VGMCNHYGRDLQMMPLDNFQDSAGIVAGIDDNRFAGLRVANNMAIALQHSDRKDFVNEFLRFPHTPQYNICRTGFSLLVLSFSRQNQTG
jgi:hypothetical protein